MSAFLDAAEADPKIRVFSPAPKEVRDMLKTARAMRQALLDRADELVARNRRRTSGDTKPYKTTMRLEAVDAA
jgi:hypothetical protein